METKMMKEVDLDEYVWTCASGSEKPVEVAPALEEGERVATVTAGGDSYDLYAPKSLLSAVEFEQAPAVSATGGKELLVDGVAVLSALRELEARIQALTPAEPDPAEP